VSNVVNIIHAGCRFVYFLRGNVRVLSLWVRTHNRLLLAGRKIIQERFITDCNNDALFAALFELVDAGVVRREMPSQEIRLATVTTAATFEIQILQPVIKQFVRRFELANLEWAAVAFVVADTKEPIPEGQARRYR